MMTSRERWLAALRMQPVDRLPFWPKFDGAYARAQAAPFQAMSTNALHGWVGSDPHIWLDPCLVETHARSAVDTAVAGGVMRIVFRTPHGELVQEQRFDEGSQAWHPTVFPLRTVEDVRAMTALYEDTTVAVDPDALAAAGETARRIGEGAVTAVGIGTSALMTWIEAFAGVEQAHYLLEDHPREAEALFDAMQRVLRRQTTLIAEHHPAELLYLVENTSTTLASPAQYRRHWLGHMRECAEITQRAGRMLALHMCGHLRALLPDLATLPVQAFEAFTSPTVGNTTLRDGRLACPRTCLIGGTNAALWLEPAEAIIAQLQRDLDALPHHRGVAVTSAGVMPPRCAPETIRQVCAWVQAYPVRQ